MSRNSTENEYFIPSAPYVQSSDPPAAGSGGEKHSDQISATIFPFNKLNDLTLTKLSFESDSANETAFSMTDFTGG